MPEYPLTLETYHPMRQLCNAWMGRIDRAIEAKKAWQLVADECQAFYSAACGFLYDPRYKMKFWNSEQGAVNPMFQVTIAKAFEMVALMSPSLNWQNPTRTAQPVKLLEVNPHIIGELMGVDFEQLQQTAASVQEMMANGHPVPYQYQLEMAQFQQIQQVIQQQQFWHNGERERRSIAARLMESVLNWTPRELRLYQETDLAITDAIVKGRGVFFTEGYRPVQSGTLMVGTFREQPENLFIDPDANRFSGRLDEAWWIARKRRMVTWEAERKWDIREGALERYASMESANVQGEYSSDPNQMLRERRNGEDNGKGKDIIEVFEVWSRMGTGLRMTGRMTDIDPNARKLERVLGDYGYFVLARGVPFFLNMDSEKMAKATTEQVVSAFRWEIPFYRDGRWPTTVLDFYPSNEQAWPLSPCGVGLGELKAIQIIFSHLLHRIWMSSRDFIVVIESARAKLEEHLKQGKDLSVIGLDGIVHKSIQDVVQFLQHPPVNRDIWEILHSLIDMWEQRTGLTPLIYGRTRNESQMRSAEEAANRQSNMMIRPDHMNQRTEQTMTCIAEQEAMGVWYLMRGNDVRELFGPLGARVFEQYVSKAPAERVLRGVEYRLEAGSARKPNKSQEIANVSQLLQYAGAYLYQHGRETGDFGPWNWLMTRWANAADMVESEGMLLKPPPPQPNPEEQQAQAEEQREQQRFQSEEQRKQESHQAEMIRNAASAMQKLEMQGDENQLKLTNRLVDMAISASQPVGGNGKAK